VDRRDALILNIGADLPRPVNSAPAVANPTRANLKRQLITHLTPSLCLGSLV